MKKLLIGIIAITQILIAGCSTKDSIYSWNDGYTESMYMYLKDDPNYSEQIELMNEYFEDAASTGKKVAPGAYAHMALLMSKNNDDAQANEYLEKEKQAFPESTHYLDFLMNLKKQKQDK